MNGEVHLAETDGLVDPLLAIDGKTAGGAVTVLVDEPCALHEHAAGAAGGIEDLAIERLDDLDDEPDDRRWSEVLAPNVAFGDRELAEEVLVDLAKRVAYDVAE